MTTTINSKLGGGFRALRHRNYRLFFFGQMISLIGTWMQTVAQGWLVLQLAQTDVELKLGIVSALQFTPILLFSVVGGALADRLPKRRVMMVTQSVLMAQALTLGLLNLFGLVELWHVMVLAAVLGITNALDMPTRQSFVVEMVGKEDLINSIALNSTAFNTARIVGPALAGLLIGVFGVTVCFLLNAFSFVAVMAGMMLMRPPFHTVGKKQEGQDMGMGAGFRYIWRTPELRATVMLVGAIGAFGLNFSVWMPVMARDVLNVGAGGYGLMMSVLGFGSLLAGLTLAFTARKAPRGLLVGAAVVFGLILISFSLSRNYFLSLGLLMALGAAMVAFNTTANTRVQLSVPDELRGRVMAVYMMVFAGTTPFGALLAGTLASFFGTPVSIVVGATLSLLAVGGTILLTRGSTLPTTKPRAAVGQTSAALSGRAKGG